MLDVAKISSKGQATIPAEIRKALRLEEGSKVAFMSDKEDSFYIINSSLIALESIQSSFGGEAKKLGLDSEGDVADWLKKEAK